jgi:hypothetical protein
LGCGLDVAVEEVDLRSQHVGEACSAFVDVVVAAGAAEQFGPRCKSMNKPAALLLRRGISQTATKRRRAYIRRHPSLTVAVP